MRTRQFRDLIHMHGKYVNQRRYHQNVEKRQMKYVPEGKQSLVRMKLCHAPNSPQVSREHSINTRLNFPALSFSDAGFDGFFSNLATGVPCEPQESQASRDRELRRYQATREESSRRRQHQLVKALDSFDQMRRQ